MMHKKLTFLILLSLPINCFSQSTGVTITFDKKFESKLSSLHKNFNTKIKKNLVDKNQQIVVSNVPGLNSNKDYLRTLCTLYLEQSFIKNCKAL